MVSMFDYAPTSTQLGTTDYSFYDADTLYDKEGKGYRLQGVNALEVDTLGKEGELGGQITLEQVSKLANEMGYTNVVKTGKMDTTGTREMIDLVDAQGRSFSRELAASNLARVQPGFDPGGRLSASKDYREFLKSGGDYEPNAFDKAAEEVNKYIEDNQRYTTDLKDTVRATLYESEFQRTDRDKQGVAYDQESVAWDTAMLGISDAAWGMASLLGDATGIESLYGEGEAGVIRARARIADQGSILTDYNDVDSFEDALQYLVNNTIMSLPYIGITAGASIVAPLTGGASYLAPVSIYSGQTWNEMGDQIKGTDNERSWVIALGSGTLQAAFDTIGLKGITGSSTKEVYNKGLQALMASGLTRAAAEGQLINATKRQLAAFAGNVGEIAKEQLASKHLATDLLRRMGTGAISEGATEGMQEAIAGISADIGSNTPIDWKDIQERAVAGIVAGSTLGGAFSIPGAAIDAAEWANIAYGVDRENPNDVASATRFAREEEDSMRKKLYLKYRRDGLSPREARDLADQNTYIHSTEEIAEHFRTQADTNPSVDKVKDRSERYEEKQKQKGVKETLSDALGEAPVLWRGQVHHTFTEEILRKSRTARMMRDMFGGGLQRIFNGADFENFKHHLLTIYKGIFRDDPENIFMQLNDGKVASDTDKERISNEIYSYVDRNGNLDLSSIPNGPRKTAIINLIRQLDTLSNQMHNDQKKYNPRLGKLKNYLLQYKAINKKAVYKNRSKFIQALKDTYNFSEEDASNLTDQILDGDMDLDEAFTVVKGGPVPTAHKRRTLGLSKQEALSEFFEKDLFVNVSTAAKSAARYMANEKFIGQDGKVLAKMFDKMQQEGLSQDEVDRIAFRMKNYLDSESGNYKRPTSQFGKTLQNIQKSFMLFTMFAGLPLSTLSSFVEIALGSRGLTKEQIFGRPGKEGGLSKLGKEFSAMINAGMTEITNASGVTNKGRTYASDGRAILRDLGFYEWDVGAATTTGVLETHAWHQKFAEKYFKLIGLQGWTNFNRATRAAIAGDFISDNLLILQERDHSRGAIRTNEEREAEEKLRNLGLDVSKNGVKDLVAYLQGRENTLTPSKIQRVESSIREAQYSFVNEAVALPKAANRPLYYLDPRFALINQFQGFMSTFTANHIPRLWNEYIKRGSPAMKYHTFAMMTTMIMLGFASQYLKDLAKYGESSPYLDDAELIRRGVLSSGLAGTSERIIEFMFPIYETRSKNAGEWVWNTASGESPSLSNLARLGQAGSHLIKGEMEEAVWDVSKATVGPAANVISNIYNKMDKWDY